MKKIALIGSLFVVLTWTGCSKKPEPLVTPTRPAKKAANPEATTGEAAASTATSEGSPKSQGEGGASLNEGDVKIASLQSVVETYYADKKRFPASIEQLVTEGYLGSVPTAPGGKKYIIDTKTGKVKSANQ